MDPPAVFGNSESSEARRQELAMSLFGSRQPGSHRRNREAEDDEGPSGGPKRARTSGPSAEYEDAEPARDASEARPRTEAVEPAILHSETRPLPNGLAVPVLSNTSDTAKGNTGTYRIEVLPFIDVEFADQRTPIEGSRTEFQRHTSMSMFLKRPSSFGRYPSHPLLAAEFSFRKFLEIAERFPNFDKAATLFFVELIRRGVVVGNGIVGDEYDFVYAVGRMLSIAGTSLSSRHDGLQYRIACKLQDGRTETTNYRPFAATQEAELLPADNEPATTAGSQEGINPDSTKTVYGTTSPNTTDHPEGDPPENQLSLTKPNVPNGDANHPDDAESPKPLSETSVHSPPPSEEQVVSEPVVITIPDDEGDSPRDEGDSPRDEGDNPGNEDEKPGDEEDKRGETVSLLMRCRDDEKNWPSACEFFNHDPSVISHKPEEGVAITGTKKTLLPFQATDVYLVLLLVTCKDKDLRRFGALLAHEMGLGKTRIYQAVQQVRLNAISLLAHCRAKETAHLHRTKDHACLLERRPGDIPCPCNRKSLSYKIATTGCDGGALVVVPANLVSETETKAMEFFESSFTMVFGGEEVTFNGMVITTWEKEKAKFDLSPEMELGLAEWEIDKEREYTDTREVQPTDFWGDPTVLLKRAGITLTAVPPDPVAGRLPASLFMVVSRTMTQTKARWENHWARILTVHTYDNEWRTVTVRGSMCWGLVIADEVHEYRSLDSGQAKSLLGIINRQSKNPWVLSLSGTPVLDSISNLALPFALIMGLPSLQHAEDFRRDLKRLDTQLTSASGSEGNAEITRTLRGFIFRSSASSFLEKPLMKKPEGKYRNVSCPIDQEYRPNLRDMTSKAKSEAIRRAAQRTRSNKNVSEATIANSFFSQPSTRDLALALQFPAYPAAMNAASEQGYAIQTTVESFKDKLAKVKTAEPRRYGCSLPPQMRWCLDRILKECSRLRELDKAAMAAYSDTEVYPVSDQRSSGFSGPKNMLVLTELPFSATALKYYVEKCMDPTKFQSTMIHADMSKEERQAAIDWLGRYRESDGAFKTYTKILISTYELCSTGLDGLKVANWEVQYAAIRNHNRLKQAAARIDRLGQQITPHVLRFQSIDHPLDALVVGDLNENNNKYGSEGFLSQVTNWEY
ncbi:hypothetical protein CcaCcLH18_12835 [Colletotrichum camelliae]|nr:hypothetical protein CcaCcLH18_12835 [Colletotrichum camelliae]